MNMRVENGATGSTILGRLKGATPMGALINDNYKMKINGKVISVSKKNKKYFNEQMKKDFQNRGSVGKREFQMLLMLIVSRETGITDFKELKKNAEEMLVRMREDIAASGQKDGINFIFSK